MVIYIYIYINIIVCCSSQKSLTSLGATKGGFLGGKKLRERKYRAAQTRSSCVTVCAAADPDRPLWFPGSTPPPWLDGRLITHLFLFFHPTFFQIYAKILCLLFCHMQPSRRLRFRSSWPL